MTSVSKIPTSRLEALQKRYEARELPDGRGWSVSIRGFEQFGQSWGSTEAEARTAMDWYVRDNHGSTDVAYGILE